MSVRILGEAESEAQEAASWYEKQKQGLGFEFLDALDAALKAIDTTPQGFSRIAQTGREVRRFVMKRFPYRIVYEVRPDDVLVVAVAHARRRPFYWKRRRA